MTRLVLMVTLGVGGFSLAAARAGAQGTAAGAGTNAAAVGAPDAYVNENPKDPAPLKLSGVEGRVRGLGGDAMPMAKVSLFTEDGHALVATVMSDKDGKFRFAKVDKGLYRVVARLPGLCAANVPIKVESSVLAKHSIEITMQPKDLDKCSYGLAK